jgi:hypothetical protein
MTLYDEHDNIVLMTEIQLKNIIDRLGKESVTGTSVKMELKLANFPKKQWK